MLRDSEDLKAVANDEGVAGELRLGAGTTALTGVLPDILVRTVARFPQISVFIKPGYSADLYRAVEKGELDAAVVLEAPFTLHKSCGWLLLREEPMVVLAPQAWRAAIRMNCWPRSRWSDTTATSGAVAKPTNICEWSE